MVVLLSLVGCTAGPDEPGAFAPPEREILGVAAASGRYVAVGGHIGGPDRPADAFIYTSADGDAWELEEFPDETILWGVAHGDGRWVAVGGQSGATVMVSDDGVAWRDAAAPPPSELQAIAFGNGVFVATTGRGDDLYLSTDGDVWEAVPREGGWGREIVFVAGRFVVYGDTSAIAESFDGQTWRATEIVEITDVNAIAGRGDEAVGLAVTDGSYGEDPDPPHFVIEGPGEWTVSGPQEGYADLLFVDGAVIVSAGAGGLLRGADLGALEPVEVGARTYHLAAHGDTEVAAWDGIWVSHDAGQGWVKAAD